MFSDMFGGFNSSKLKPNLKMAVSRIQIASNKKSALLKQNMREIALLLAEDPPREEKAKIKAEALIRDDNMIEAYEILQLNCELLHERIKLIEFSKTCPADLKSVISTLIWAAHRVEIPELLVIRKQFRAKYGKNFEEEALENVGGVLNERVVTKLSVEPPAAYLVQTYLERICEQFEVKWEPKYKLSPEEMVEPMAAPVGYSVAVGTGTGLGGCSAAEAVTGQRNADEEIDYMKQNGGIPPPVVTATAEPYVPPSMRNGVGGKPGGNDFEEVDIYIPPGAPTAPAGSSIGNSSPISDAGKGNRNTGDDGNDDGSAPGASTGASAPSGSYADLAARFDQLNKK